MRRSGLTLAAAAAMLASVPAAAASTDVDANNSSCPKQLNWSTYRQMRFTVETVNGARVLKAEGMIDEAVPDRLREALSGNAPIDEIWFRSPGAPPVPATRQARSFAMR